MSTPVTNFAKATVSTGYNSAAVTIVLTSGHGSKFPSTFPYPLTWWNATDYPDPSDDPSVEIVTVTARTSDTLTVTRASEGTSASNKNTGGKTYKMVLAITKAMWEDVSASGANILTGLRVQTHPDNDVALKQVLFSADAIVMNEGTQVTGWTNVMVDLSASGAGGLDTGSEQASTWYSLWAIYDGTNKKGLLHREKNYLLDQDGSAGEDGGHALRDATARTKLAQGFKTTNAGLIEFIDVHLYKVAAPTGNYWFTIEANNAGVPSNTPLATSDKYDVSRLLTATSPGWTRIPFRTPVAVSAATQYHLVLQGDFAVSGTNYMVWRADTTAAAYANGSKAAYDGTNWAADGDDDFIFKLYVTQNDAALVLPTGYTKYALLSYCYNDGSSNLLRFSQVGLRIFGGYDAGWKLGALANTVAQLIATDAVLPPRPVMVEWSLYNASAATMKFGLLSITDLVSTGPTEAKGTIGLTLSAAYLGNAGAMTVDFNGLMFATSVGTANVYVQSFSW